MPIWPSPLHSLVSKENIIQINMCSRWNEFVQCTIEFVHYISVQHVIQAHSISFQWTLTRWVWQTMPTRSACYLTFNPSSTSSRLEGKKVIFLHGCNWHEISIVQFSIYNGIRNPSCVSHFIIIATGSVFVDILIEFDKNQKQIPTTMWWWGEQACPSKILQIILTQSSSVA